MISKWKEVEATDAQKFVSENCVHGEVSIRGSKAFWITMNQNGMMVTTEIFKSFNDAARFLEATFDWNINLKEM